MTDTGQLSELMKLKMRLIAIQGILGVLMLNCLSENNIAAVKSGLLKTENTDMPKITETTNVTVEEMEEASNIIKETTEDFFQMIEKASADIKLRASNKK